MSRGDARERSALALAVGALLVLCAIPAHVAFYRHAGALWRDEVNLVNVASFPTLGEVFAHCQLDSFPYVWLTLFYSWMSAFGADDATLRLFGLAVGLATIAVVWWSGRRLGLDAPVLTLILFCLSPSVILYGDAVRGYGMGAAALIWAIGAMWSFVRAPSGSRFALVLAAALISVQTYVPNGILLAATGLGAAAVCWRRRSWGALLALAAVGALACASLVLVLPWIRYAMQVAEVEQSPTGWSLAWLFGVFRGALAPQAPVLGALWTIAPALALLGAAWTCTAPDAPADDRDLAVFAIVTGLASLVLFFAYLRLVARLPTQFWYYVSLMGALALCIDAGVWLLAKRVPYGREGRLALALLVAVLATSSVVQAVQVRMTTVDRIAAKLEQDVRPDDLVVVLPWFVGISFARYYRGAAPWISLPDLDEHRFHLHLLVADKMKRGDKGVAPELARVEETLKHGGRVWVVGALRAPPDGEAPPSVPPAPQGPERWRAAPYLDAWELQLGALLRAHAGDVWKIDFTDLGAVSPWEAQPLFRTEGWRDTAAMR